MGEEFLQKHSYLATCSMKFENAISLRYKDPSCVILKKYFIIYLPSFYVLNCKSRIYICNIIPYQPLNEYEYK